MGKEQLKWYKVRKSDKVEYNECIYQLVMLAYNIWRSFKMLSGYSQLEESGQEEEGKNESKCAVNEVINNRIRTARL